MMIQQSPSLLWAATWAEESLRDMIHERCQSMFLNLLKAEKERRRGASGASCVSTEAVKDVEGVDSMGEPPKFAESPDVQRKRWLSAAGSLDLRPRVPVDLDLHAVGSISTVYYVPSVLNESEEGEICARIAASGLSDKWISLRGRQLQNWGGIPPDSCDSLPSWLQQVCFSLVQAGVFPPACPPNHVLVNEYHPGQGIMAHTDGPAYQSNIAILSMRDSVKFRFTPRDVGDRGGFSESLIVQPQSLLLFRNDACVDFMHGIPEDVEDVVDDTVVNCEAAGVRVGQIITREHTRYSITIRRALFATDETNGIVSAACCSLSSKPFVKGSDWEAVMAANVSKLATVIGSVVSCGCAGDVDGMRRFLGTPGDATLHSYAFTPRDGAQWANLMAAVAGSAARMNGATLAGTICCLKCAVTPTEDGVIVQSATDVFSVFGDVPYELSLWF